MSELLRKLAEELSDDDKASNLSEYLDDDEIEEEGEKSEEDDEEEDDEEEEDEEKEASLIQKIAADMKNGDSPDDATAAEDGGEEEEEKEEEEEEDEEEEEERSEDDQEAEAPQEGMQISPEDLYAVIDFFQQNPEPLDEDFQAFADQSGMSPEAFESITYILAGRMANLLRSGAFNQSGIDVNSVDPNELEAGINVEYRHTDDPALAKKLALDNLSQIPDYYTRLNTMMQEASGQQAPIESNGQEVSQTQEGQLPYQEQ